MSKAFTRESDDDPGSASVSLARQHLPPGTRNYITKEGASRLNRQLKLLLEQKQAVSIENEQRKLESEIRQLQLILNSVVVAEIPIDREKVAFGASVTVQDANGDEDAYRIVGVDEASPERGNISWISPLARAIMSRRVGEKVRFQSPSGVRELAILRISYSEES